MTTVEEKPSAIAAGLISETPVDEMPSDDILLDIREVHGYQLRRLSFGKLAVITPMMAGLAGKVRTLYPTGVPMLDSGTILTIIMTLMPDILPIVAKIVDAPTEEITAMGAMEGFELTVAIWEMNNELFMRFFILGSSLARRD